MMFRDLRALDELAAPYLSVHNLLMTAATNARMLAFGKGVDQRKTLYGYALACERVATALANEGG